MGLVPERGSSRSWEIRSGRAVLPAELDLPPHPEGLVVVAYPAATRRLDPRERFVAHVLRQAGLGTLLLDLLTPEEEPIDQRTGEFRFDVAFLADRLQAAIDRSALDKETEHLPLGLFGTGTAGASVLSIAATLGDGVHSVVVRSGRPDLAGRALPQVTADTLLIVGEHDPWVLERNREALAHLHSHRYLYVVPGASHAFEEPGALDAAARAGAAWFTRAIALRGPPAPVADGRAPAGARR